MARAEWTHKKLGESDIRVLRSFIKQGLQPYVDDIREFYLSVKYLSDLSTGCHAWAVREHGNGALGYMVVRGGSSDFASTTVFPYVNPSKIDLGVPGGTRPAILEEVLREPIIMEDFYVYYRRGKVCFLSEELHDAEKRGTRLQAVMVFTRGEAFALLDGKVLSSTKEKLRKAFGIREVLE